MTRFVGGFVAVVIGGVLLMQTARAGDSIKGQVVFAGAVGKPAAITATNDKAYCEKCEKNGLFSEELIVDPKTKGLKNVLVFLVDAKNPLRPFRIRR